MNLSFTAAKNKWWNFVNVSEKMPMIGENISLDAYLFYDETYQLSNEGDNQYFNKLFKEVEEYLHNRSIMINITVKEAVKNNNLTVYFESNKTIDGRRTLENLTTYGASMHKPNNSVFFLFTWDKDNADKPTAGLIDYINPNGLHRLGVSEVSTENSFCSTNTSAAVIRHRHESHNYWSIIRALLTMFGSKHFILLDNQDWENMNKTFS
ncbi:uncharacterized protein LOC119463428 [Dermacentor silvarum]|uniref:uncharacterized protein LOC119463428 n=1 Tax=Dermacentor silvarum TaxID=543639 RepID=UPI002101BB22|nr:uncharacterized protein LOC119463428 [Dermacentor silvarum]